MLFQLVQGSRLNPMNNAGVRDVVGKPMEIKRNLETVGRAKQQLKTIEKMVNENKNDKKKEDKKENEEMIRLNENFGKVTQLLGGLSMGRKVIKDVKPSEINGEVIFISIVERVIDGLDRNDLIPQEFSEFLGMKDEILALMRKSISTELEQFEEFLKFTKDEKKEIANFINNLDGVIDNLIVAYIKNDDNLVDKEMEKVPSCLVKAITNISNSEKELNLGKLEKIMKGFMIDKNINVDFNSLIEKFEKLEAIKEGENKLTFINSEALVKRLIDGFGLSIDDISTLLNNGTLSFEESGYKNEFTIKDDRLLECKFTNIETNEIATRIVLFNEEGIVYEN